MLALCGRFDARHACPGREAPLLREPRGDWPRIAVDPTSASQVAPDTPVRGDIVIRRMRARHVAAALALGVGLALVLSATPVTAALRQYWLAEDMPRRS